jgi:hypothetical protein
MCKSVLRKIYPEHLSYYQYSSYPFNGKGQEDRSDLYSKRRALFVYCNDQDGRNVKHTKNGDFKSNNLKSVDGKNIISAYPKFDHSLTSKISKLTLLSTTVHMPPATTDIFQDRTIGSFKFYSMLLHTMHLLLFHKSLIDV